MIVRRYEDQYLPISFINVWLPNCFPVLHQNGMLTSNKPLQGSPGSRLRQALSHSVWLACSYLPKWAKIKNATAWFSHSKRKWSERACCTFSNIFLTYLITILFLFPFLSVWLSLHPSSYFSNFLVLFFFFFPSSGSVPTVPPGNVQAEPVNSTTVRFTWSAPSPQFINGINQGYKVNSPPSVNWCSLVVRGRRALFHQKLITTVDYS